MSGHLTPSLRGSPDIQARMIARFEKNLLEGTGILTGLSGNNPLAAPASSPSTRDRAAFLRSIHTPIAEPCDLPTQTRVSADVSLGRVVGRAVGESWVSHSRSG